MANGAYDVGNDEASRAAISLMAKALGIKEAALHDAIKKEIARRLCAETINLCFPDDASMILALSHHWFDKGKASLPVPSPLSMSLAMNMPVLAIGAPAKAWLPHSYQYLSGSCILPKNFMVGTAIGAAVGNISFTIQAEVRPIAEDRFILFSLEEKVEFRDLDQAINVGKKALEAFAKGRMEANGVKDFSMNMDIQKHCVPIPGGELHLFTTITLQATSDIPVTQT